MTPSQHRYRQLKGRSRGFGSGEPRSVRIPKRFNPLLYIYKIATGRGRLTPLEEYQSLKTRSRIKHRPRVEKAVIEIDVAPPFPPRPAHIESSHWHELTIGSGIDTDIARLNCESVGGSGAWSRVMGLLPHKERRNDGRVRDWIVRNYAHLDDGGLWVSGLDPLNHWQPMEWGQLKPNAPRLKSDGSGKIVKYEACAKTPTRTFWARVTWKIGLSIAKQSGHYDEYIERIQRAYQQTAQEQSSKAATEKAGYEGGSQSSPTGFPSGTDLSRKSGRVVSANSRPGLEKVSITFLENEDSGFWQWVLDTPQVPLVITEGAKKAAAILTAGFAAVALPGVYNWGDKRNNNKTELHPDLKAIAADKREIYLAFDRDAKRITRKNVSKQISKFASVLKRAGCKVLVCDWLPEQGKGADDFIVNGGDFGDIVRGALTHEFWSVRQYRELTYDRAIIVPETQQYLGDIPLPHHKLIGIKAPKGTGKTELICQYVAMAKQWGIPVLVITHRVQLAKALAQRFGIEHIDNVGDEASELGISKRLLASHGVQGGAIDGIALCTDSLRSGAKLSFNPEDWKDALVVIDEAEQVCWHTLQAATDVRNYRVEVLGNLSSLFEYILSPNSKGKIILSDADLSDPTVDRVLGHAPKADPDIGIEETVPYIIESRYRGGGYDAYFYSEPSPEMWLSSALYQAEKGERILMMTGGQKVTSTWGTQTLEGLVKQQLPKLRVLRIDAETVANPQHPAYRIVEHLERLRNFDFVIVSPTFETGISIDIKGHFHAVYLASFGLQTADAVRQALIRLRELVPRHIWVSSSAKALGKIGNGSLYPSSLLKGERKKSSFTLKYLQMADAEFSDNDDEVISVNQKQWAQYAARINADNAYYRRAIMVGLAEEGHRVKRLKKGKNDAIKKLAAAIKEGNKETLAQLIRSAARMSEKEYQDSKDKREKTDEQRHKERRYEVCDRYGVEEPDIELILADMGNFYRKVRLHYAATVGHPYLRDRVEKTIETLVDRGEGRILNYDFNSRSKTARMVAILRDVLGVLDLVDNLKGRAVNKEDPVLVEFYHRAHQFSRDLRDLGISLPEKGTKKDSPIVVANMFLRKLGMPLRNKNNDRETTGVRHRIYRLDIELAERRPAFFEYWRQQDEEFVRKRVADKEAARQAAEEAKRNAAYLPTQQPVETPVSPSVEVVGANVGSEVVGVVGASLRGVAARLKEAIADCPLVRKLHGLTLQIDSHAPRQNPMQGNAWFVDVERYDGGGTRLGTIAVPWEWLDVGGGVPG